MSDSEFPPTRSARELPSECMRVFQKSHISARIVFLLSAKRYLVVVEAITCAYNLVIMFLASKGSLWSLVIILDIVVAVLLASSVSSALAIASVGRKGNTHAG
ncbi:hypothetical protein ACLB2K_033059 [Fragaria x ananassa]